MTFFMNCNKHVILNVLLASSRVPKGRWIQLQYSSRLNWILRDFAPQNDAERSKVIQ